MSIIDTLRYQWRVGSMLIKLIFINVGIYLCLTVVSIVAALFNSAAALQMLGWLQLSSVPSHVLYRPWTVITYMFVQTDFWHLCFNMLWLYWFGTVFLSLDTARRLTALYIYGGIGGALLFVAGFLLLPGLEGASATLTGSSAAVIAVVTATTVRYPDFKLNLFIFGSVALKWIGIVTVGFCLIQSQLPVFSAHFGGVLVGFIYAMLMRRGIDVTRRLNSCIDMVVNIFKSRDKRNAGVDIPYDRVDEIINKVKRSGYASLSDDEKRYLFRSK